MITSLAAQLDSFSPNIASTAEELDQLITSLKQTLTNLEINYIRQFALEQGIWDFYPTPYELIQKMLELANIQPHHRVLEPSAGAGDLCQILRNSGVKQIDCFEVHPLLQKALKLQGYNLLGDDFLSSTPQPVYDRIIANPPFSRSDVANHTQHAYQFLKSGGKLVTLAHHYQLKPSSSDRRFFSWLDWVNARFLNCNQAMSHSDRPTNTPLQLILISKP
ncbi:methyltransferase [Myxosarcina sp. GI1]|uniref:methyltransferase n=1 Tax=Myxosarcina sp. GI1 TaxID=1541065 RepID=UPI00055C75C2|nr:methyltransferase [Myxosarcina sp. GI1]